MIRAIIFDADGVIIHGEKYFSERLQDEYGIPREKSLEFFNGEFLECLIGKKDLKIILPRYLKEWGWKKSLEELLEYWFAKEGKRDEELIAYINKLRKKGIKIFIGTNNERHRTDYLKEYMGFGKLADKVYASGYVGYAKPDYRFFEYIIKEQNLKKDEVLFWDDDEENVASAREFGLNAEIYIKFEEFEKQIDRYILFNN